jgi:polysaccharide export outer membrane protein
MLRMKRLYRFKGIHWLVIPLLAVFLGACATSTTPAYMSAVKKPTVYKIGPGDQLEIYVRNNKDLTVTVPVRPDGRISIPLVQSMTAAGKTPSQLSKDLEHALSKYIRQPIVTVIVAKSVGAYSEQVRVVGQATKPQALSYRHGMSLLDVLIAVGGLTPYADGNGAKIIRHYHGKKITIPVDLEDLLNGDTEDNIPIRPGDILIIPKSLF